MSEEPFDVFFSYGRSDKPLVERLVRRCEAEGWSIWWDHELRAGDEFAPTIQTYLQTARAVIVCWSENSSRSPWVRDEATIAIARGVAVPVSLDGSAPPIGFGQFHTVDVARFVMGGEDELSEVIDAVKQVIAGKRGAGFSIGAIVTRNRWPGLPMLIGGGLVLAATLVGAATLSVNLLQEYLKPAAPTRFAQLKKAEILMSEIDDIMTVTINDATRLRAEFGQVTNWTDVTRHLKKGPNTIAMMILNGPYGGCGGALQLRMNGFVSTDHQWKFGTAAGNTEGKAPNVMCYNHVFTVILD